MADTGCCEQCGALFERRREHARFCSARCRVAWNRARPGDRAGEGSALDWSILAMRDATVRLARARAYDKARAFAVISEAVWWTTIVDATFVRYHPDVYDAVLEAAGVAERQAIEGTLAGLRFVRNQMGHDLDHADFIRLTTDRGDRVTACEWASLAVPSLSSLSGRGRSWEMSRYRDYQAHLAEHPVGETFGRTEKFLRQAADAASALTQGMTG